MTDILGYKKEAYQLRQMLQILIRRFGLLEKRRRTMLWGFSYTKSYLI
ncbi:hypothetical protein ACT7CX_25440 [Bacillus cereus]